nr:proline-rich protein 36-like [Aegilops tauschii subsp. strangulata]
MSSSWAAHDLGQIEHTSVLVVVRRRHLAASLARIRATTPHLRTSELRPPCPLPVASATHSASRRFSRRFFAPAPVLRSCACCPLAYTPSPLGPLGRTPAAVTKTCPQLLLAIAVPELPASSWSPRQCPHSLRAHALVYARPPSASAHCLCSAAAALPLAPAATTVAPAASLPRLGRSARAHQCPPHAPPLPTAHTAAASAPPLPLPPSAVASGHQK